MAKYWVKVPLTDIVEDKFRQVFEEGMIDIQTERNDENFDALVKERDDYYNCKMPDTNFPLGEDSSNRHIPLTTVMVDVIEIKALKHTLSSSPIIKFELLDELPKDLTKENLRGREDRLDMRIRKDIEIEKLLSAVYREACIQGVSFVKVPPVNDKEWVRYNEIYKADKAGLARFEKDNPDYKDSKELSDSYKLLKKFDDSEVEVVVDKKQTIFQGMRPKRVELKDLFIRLKNTNFRKHRLIAEKMTMTKQDIQEKASSGYYDQEQVDKLFERELAINAENNDKIAENPVYTVYESIMYFSMNNDKKYYRYIADIEETTKTILRAIYYPFKHNKIYYIPYYTKPLDNKTIGISLVDRSIETNDMYDGLWRAFLNQILIVQKPPICYKSTELTYSLTGADFEPGRVNPGITPRDIWQMDVKNPDAYSINAIQMAERICEIPSGVGSIQSGQSPMPSKVSTLGENVMRANESNMRVENYIINLQVGNADLAEQIEKGEAQFNKENYLKYYNGNTQTLSDSIINVPVRYIPQGLTMSIDRRSDLNIIITYMALLKQYFPEDLQDKYKKHELIKAVIDNSGGSLTQIKNVLNIKPEDEAKNFAVDSIVNLLRKVAEGQQLSPEEIAMLQNLSPGGTEQTPPPNTQIPEAAAIPAGGQV